MARGNVVASVVYLTLENAMASRYEQLLALYPEGQLRQMERVRDAMLDDPTALDNRKDEVLEEEGAPK